MPIRNNLISDIRNTLTSSMPPSLSSSSDASDLYEAYLFALICEAARTEGATVSFRSINSSNPSSFIFRTSPGYISSKTHDYGYGVINFQGKPLLEAHVGVRVAGASKVLHECDICVLFHDEAELCRTSSGNVAPRASKLVIAVEAKFYTSSLGLGLGRGFLGFTLDMSAIDKAYFVTNRPAPSIGKLLSHKKRYWDKNIQPQNTNDVDRLRNQFQTAFKDFCAKN